MSVPVKATYYEFFAGGGMARAGLEGTWECLFANDVDRMKADVYLRNWGSKEFIAGDIAAVTIDQLPGRADLVWASFPCQDTSVAGVGRGLGQQAALLRTRSGAFWSMMDIVRRLDADDRAPRVLVLENVLGLLTVNGGSDFVATIKSLSENNYRSGAVVVDASLFLPQSRPRVFIIAVRKEDDAYEGVSSRNPILPWHPDPIQRARKHLSAANIEDWIWWDLGTAPQRQIALSQIIGRERDEIKWHSADETARLMALMSAINLDRLNDAGHRGGTAIGSLYLRMRPAGGRNEQRAEVSFNETFGCLRTPRGGGSRPRIVVVEGKTIKSRQIVAREAAELMGLPAQYMLPPIYDHAFKVIGDGLAVPVVKFLRDRLLRHLVVGGQIMTEAA
ncbi:DNA cytosine methyltransferase [Lichenibacterium minor]|uniref:DNA (cytosine-5-)-methyltransferase n=1 Tax=Lichenibacterium minor TaxID=2316528 RepID=A0A4Q2U140_9HYPH|nr:DNA (cytosine-5-)-methyltransferase [Lichenibacterium minor]RYC30159.1 DNA cytosine methyltransferase [Lichenibacterium minor]